MSDVTVAQFAEVLKVPVDRLLVQLESAGIQVEGPQALISDEAKLELLTHLRRAHGAAEPSKTAGAAAPRKITLARKSQSELKQASQQGRARTVNVEVRHKKTYIKRDVLEEQNKQSQGAVDEKRKELEAQLNPTAMDEILRNMEGLIGAQLEAKDLKYQYLCDDLRICASAEAAKVQQIMLNLLANAIKFTPAGGSIILECVPEGDAVAIRVIDSGIGIPADRVSALFTAFTQTPNSKV